MKPFPVVAALLITLGAAVGCDRRSTPTAPTPPPTSPTSPTSPSSPAASASRLTYTVPAAARHGASSGDYTTANASFRGSVRTTCVPNPNVLGSVCPDLMVNVDPVSETDCQLWAFAPAGETLGARAYPNAQRGPGAGVAGLSFNCGRGGTTCNWSVGQFTVHELQADAAGTVTRLHLTFSQTCARNDTLSTEGFGTATGELWIVDGTTPY